MMLILTNDPTDFLNTLVDKANVLATSRLWRNTVTEIAEQYPEVTLEFLLIENATMKIIKNPKQFDVILTTNLFGDILSVEASVITGSIGLMASSSIGKKNALFQGMNALLKVNIFLVLSSLLAPP